MRLALTFCLLTAAASAQSVKVGTARSQRHGDIVTNKRGLTLPAGEFTIREMIDAVASYLCRNYLYDPTVINEQPPLLLQRAISLDALGSEEVLYALLASRNLVALPLDEVRGVFQIVPLAQNHESHPMASIPWRRPRDLVLRPHFRELVMTAITLQNLNAPQVTTALRSHFSMLRTWQPGAPSVSYMGPRTLVLHGYGDQLIEVVQALSDLDRLATPAKPSPKSTMQTDNAALLKRLEALEREVAELKKLLGK